MPLRKFLFQSILLLALAGAGTLYAQPKMKIVDGTKIDYGTIYSNQIMRKEITLKNNGSDTLVVSGVSSSCGCTVAIASNEGHIPPKATGKITVSFDPERFSGSVTKGISFETNDPKMPHAHVDFTVNISKFVEVSSDYLTFPDAVVDSTIQNIFTIKNTTTKTIKFLSVVSTSPFLEADTDIKEMKPNETATVTLTLRPKAKGIVKGNVNIDTDNANIPRISTRFFALVKNRSDLNKPLHN